MQFLLTICINFRFVTIATADEKLIKGVHQGFYNVHKKQRLFLLKKIFGSHLTCI